MPSEEFDLFLLGGSISPNMWALILLVNQFLVEKRFCALRYLLVEVGFVEVTLREQVERELVTVLQVVPETTSVVLQELFRRHWQLHNGVITSYHLLHDLDELSDEKRDGFPDALRAETFHLFAHQSAFEVPERRRHERLVPGIKCGEEPIDAKHLQKPINYGHTIPSNGVICNFERRSDHVFHLLMAFGNLALHLTLVGKEVARLLGLNAQREQLEQVQRQDVTLRIRDGSFQNAVHELFHRPDVGLLVDEELAGTGADDDGLVRRKTQTCWRRRRNELLERPWPVCGIVGALLDQEVQVIGVVFHIVADDVPGEFRACFRVVLDTWKVHENGVDAVGHEHFDFQLVSQDAIPDGLHVRAHGVLHTANVHQLPVEQTPYGASLQVRGVDLHL
ncbi:glycosyl transferase group 1, putative [Babesia ovata]|uniref:Glycosyl transferase group 1, putative n=1 Tax=Babesia ovata TaxID=189622 RepID=A0A2H6KBK8_9APIC|nr:glycosyl transferase group 1, putative [Babesia ovata]GBE60349.1 glycosyl transferase group 1, putative [Babesia ovata]